MMFGVTLKIRVNRTLIEIDFVTFFRRLIRAAVICRVVVDGCCS